MKRLLALLSVVVSLATLTACLQPAAGDVLQSAKPRVTSPDVAPADLNTLANGNTAFALDIYRAISKVDGNIFYSPYSMSLALAMTYAGARGETERQMRETLHFILPQDRLHPAFNGLSIELGKRGEGAQGKDGKGFRLNIVNAIWGQKGYEFLGQYLDTLSQNYGSGLRLLDFVKQPEASRITINDWVSSQTEERIKDLIPPGIIDELTRLVLTNAIYFNAAWQYPFNEAATTDSDFNLLDGGKVTVPMMRQTEAFGYTRIDGFQAIELPYDGNELSMVILLPESGEFDMFESSLRHETLEAILDELTPWQMDLTLPKFQFEASLALKDTLAAMGMPVAFSDDADFSGMTGNRELSITDVVHKAFVSVDEAGTEAAAATAVIVGTTSVPAAPIEVRVDRPFVFLIRDIKTETILFLGRVVNPAQ